MNEWMIRSVVTWKLAENILPDHPLVKFYKEERQEHKIIIKQHSTNQLKEIDKWCIENIQSPWCLSRNSADEWEYSFADLSIATLFRLRF